MAEFSTEEIASQITKELASTALGCSALTPLTGGTVNFIFKGQLLDPLDDGTKEVLIKHGKGCSASFSSLALSTDRCALESDCLKAAELRLPPTINDACSVRTPKVFLYNTKSNTQVQEYLPNSLDLKTYALKHFSVSMPSSTKPQIIEIGRGLGKWLRNFHDWAATQKLLRDLARANKEMQSIKLKYNYALLPQRVDSFPTILEDARPVFEEVLAMAQAELQDEADLHIIHGDFWTGNGIAFPFPTKSVALPGPQPTALLQCVPDTEEYLTLKSCPSTTHRDDPVSHPGARKLTGCHSILLPNEDIRSGHQISLFVIDWEMCQLSKPQLDLGQMIAELYELTLYKDMQAGLWLIDGFVSGYGFVDDDFALRTLLHVGTHLVGFGSRVAGWGTPEQCQNVARTGRDIILRAWHKDRDWFEKHDLASLFEKD